MKCLSPFWLGGYKTSALSRRVELPIPFGLPVPCGHCLSCRMQQSSVWSLRLSFELQKHSDVAFITLTYDNEHLPFRYALCPPHLTLFWKLLRKNLSYKIRYFAVGEYGEKRGRPHYHAIIFGLKECDFHLVEKCWKKGLVDVQVFDALKGGIEYVAGYVTKKIGAGYSKYHPRGCAEFMRCSLGLGLSYFMEIMPFYSAVIRFKDKLRYVGRYLKNKLAEKFNICDKILAQGVISLIDSTQYAIDTYALANPREYKVYERRAGILFDYALEKRAWSWHISGLQNLLEAKNRLYLLNKKRL